MLTRRRIHEQNGGTGTSGDLAITNGIRDRDVIPNATLPQQPGGGAGQGSTPAVQVAHASTSLGHPLQLQLGPTSASLPVRGPRSPPPQQQLLPRPPPHQPHQPRTQSSATAPPAPPQPPALVLNISTVHQARQTQPNTGSEAMARIGAMFGFQVRQGVSGRLPNVPSTTMATATNADAGMGVGLGLGIMATARTNANGDPNDDDFSSDDRSDCTDKVANNISGLGVSAVQRDGGHQIAVVSDGSLPDSMASVHLQYGQSKAFFEIVNDLIKELVEESKLFDVLPASQPYSTKTAGAYRKGRMLQQSEHYDWLGCLRYDVICLDGASADSPADNLVPGLPPRDADNDGSRADDGNSMGQLNHSAMRDDEGYVHRSVDGKLLETINTNGRKKFPDTWPKEGFTDSVASGLLLTIKGQWNGANPGPGLEKLANRQCPIHVRFCDGNSKVDVGFRVVRSLGEAVIDPSLITKRMLEFDTRLFGLQKKKIPKWAYDIFTIKSINSYFTELLEFWEAHPNANEDSTELFRRPTATGILALRSQLDLLLDLHRNRIQDIPFLKGRESQIVKHLLKKATSTLSRSGPLFVLLVDVEYRSVSPVFFFLAGASRLAGVKRPASEVEVDGEETASDAAMAELEADVDGANADVLEPLKESDADGASSDAAMHAQERDTDGEDEGANSSASSSNVMVADLVNIAEWILAAHQIPDYATDYWSASERRDSPFAPKFVRSGTWIKDGSSEVFKMVFKALEELQKQGSIANRIDLARLLSR